MPLSRVIAITLSGAALALGISGCPNMGDSELSPACSNCAAISPTLYAGSGTGIWRYSNSTDAPVPVPVGIRGLTGQHVTLVFTNDAHEPHQMTSMRLDQWRRVPPEGGLRTKKGSPVSAQAASVTSVGEGRSWYHHDGTLRDTTLARQSTMRDGVVVNLWVENSENNDTRVGAAVLDKLHDTYVRAGGIYDMMVDIGGPLWGPHDSSNLIDGSAQPVNLVILNFNRDRPDDLNGYFHTRNALRRVPETQSAKSNEAVVLFLNSANLEADVPETLEDMLLNLAHESMHMQSFYRRRVKLGAEFAFERWLEEGLATMVTDHLASALTPGFNPARDSQVPGYMLNASYDCALMAWGDVRTVCDGDAVWGSFGAFLNRQLGMQFFRNLLNDTTHKSSAEALDAAIRSVRPESGTVEEVRRWAASLASAIPLRGLPAGYGFPARADGAYPLPEIDLQLYKHRMPDAIPPTLAGHASFPLVRRAVRGTYEEVISVPPRSTLQVVIHQEKV